MATTKNSALTVAIVEDNPVHRETYANMIQFDSANHEVEIFENAKSFLKEPDQFNHYDCVLLDIKLPDMNGIDLARKIREIAPALPTLFITAYSDDSEALETLSEGADDYLPKGEYNQKLFMRSIRYAIERKKYQVEHLKLMEDLRVQRELNAQQKEFVSLVSHEFRTPLAVISSSAQLIARQDDTSETTKRHLKKITNATKRLAALIDNALCFSKLEEGKIAFNPITFDLQQHLADLVDSHRTLHPEMTFELTGDTLPTRYQGDPEILDHILFNLLSNAVKYSTNPDRCTITIKCDVPNDGGLLTLHVIDQGCGIPADALEHIGERFYRAPNTIGISGTGIGLHLVKQLAEMHYGELILKSEENKGTTVSISLPLNQKGDS